MKRFILAMSLVAVIGVLASCNSNTQMEKKVVNAPYNQEKELLKDAIKAKSPEVQTVEIIDSTVVFTHIYDGIIDVKAYTFDGDVCVEVERVYTFPTQMSALRHYRRAVERAELYNDIQLNKNQVKYNLKEEQHKLETKGMTKEQLKAKFDKQIADCKADAQCHHEGRREHHRK